MVALTQRTNLLGRIRRRISAFVRPSNCRNPERPAPKALRQLQPHSSRYRSHPEIPYRSRNSRREIVMCIQPRRVPRSPFGGRQAGEGGARCLRNVELPRSLLPSEFPEEATHLDRTAVSQEDNSTQHLSCVKHLITKKKSAMDPATTPNEFLPTQSTSILSRLRRFAARGEGASVLPRQYR